MGARVPGEPDAALLPESAEVLAELFSGDFSFFVGFIGKADRIDDAVRLEIAGSGYGLTITDSVAVVTQVDARRPRHGPLEAAMA